jgi:hypothetical protein
MVLLPLAVRVSGVGVFAEFLLGRLSAKEFLQVISANSSKVSGLVCVMGATPNYCS